MLVPEARTWLTYGFQDSGNNNYIDIAFWMRLNKHALLSTQGNTVTL